MNSQFHLLRPEWLLALLPLIFFSWMLLRKKLFSRNWQSVIDPKLLPHLLIGKPGKASRIPVFIFFIGGAIGTLSLAGPVWEKLPQPVFKQQSALIIAVDLSRSMNATDIKPSRLARARHKISDILKFRKEGQTALIAYASEAFIVTPLTDDVATIESLISSMETNLMPAQGSRTDSALEKATELLKNSAINKGDLILITDGINPASNNAFDKFEAAGHRVSILAIGTREGGPITIDNGGFLKDDSGSIVIPKLNSSNMRSTAIRTGGRFSLMTNDDTDIKHLLALLEINKGKAESTQTDMKADVWREEGPWLLLLLIPLAAVAFRRGYLSLIFILILPFPQPADALSWDELWTNDNQRAAIKLQQNNASDAARLFNNKAWKASAHFKAEQYEQALEQYEGLDNTDAHYNRGNTLAKMNRTDEAIEAYNKALESNPEHEDALYNKELLEKQQNEQQKKKGDNSEDEKNKSDKEKSDDSSEQQSSKDNQQQNEQQQDSQSENEQQQDQQNNSEQSDEQQSKEEQQAQQDEKDKSDLTEEAKNNKKDNQQLDELEQQADLSKQATEQWLRKIPDNPGGLLRKKFKFLHQRQNNKTSNGNPW
jgi:Ca-activated chloride channel homolog